MANIKRIEANTSLLLWQCDWKPALKTSNELSLC